MDFQLKLEFIELDNLLKAANLAVSGVDARQHIMAGLIKINGQVETRIRRKLRSGDFVEFDKHQIRIVESNNSDGSNFSKERLKK